MGVQRLKDEAFDRALNGELIPVFVGGKLMGYRRKKNDRLLMFCLRHYGQGAAGERVAVAVDVFAPRKTAMRPDAAAPIYPVIAMQAPIAHAGSRRNLIGADATPASERAHSPHLNVRADAPPCFLLHAEDDRSVPVENTLLLRAALQARGVSTQTHLFPDGGHGFGLRLSRGKSVEGWPDLFHAWGGKQGLFV